MRKIPTVLMGSQCRRLVSLILLSKSYGISHQSAAKPEKGLTPEQLVHSEDTSCLGALSENIACSSPIPKKKFAILMAYCGLGYYGMQMNRSRPDLPTIESTLMSALVEAHCVPEMIEKRQLRFQRCARTDKGVSALGQVVSLRLLTSCTNPVEKINSSLPPEIRIIDIKRVTKGFSSKNMCDGRSYSYMVPTFALSKYAPSIPDSRFRLPRDDFHQVNSFLSFYKGTHNFHNFTTKTSSDDPSAWRHIFDISCSEPFVHHGIEFAYINVTGHSFMLYQIRKMVGLIIAVTKGVVTSDLIPQCVQIDKVNIPPAPGLGLVLESVYYERYNRRYGGDGVHQELKWEESLPFVASFREKKIIPVILNGELDNFSMTYWLDHIKKHNFIGFNTYRDLLCSHA
ncbi:pseudouridylate synthase 1 homolog [Bombina bombina]|uniref:pseudouridylate synthase 1 homolog n=1 Tax=Bombina bombina TaxID=8345 RepID=UPI00235AE388|nr:pseudouridylate synthase 1 homolog [Bombina bombina]